MTHISVSARLLLNVEALNAVESIGNVTRHRRVPVVVQQGNKFVLRYVPAISGESFAHGYQETMAMLAEKLGLNICARCKGGEFVKHADDTYLEEDELSIPKDAKDAHELEKKIINLCTVEDIGGFMYAGTTPVKRTSVFQVGYLVPALEDLSVAALESQFHVRHVPSVLVSAREKAGQMIYYVEVGSAIYSFIFNLDIDKIGKTSMLKIEEVIEENERKQRIRVAITALSHLLANGSFGAKRSRFTPLYEVQSLVAVISNPVTFSASPATNKNYIKDTTMRAEKFSKLMKDLGIKETICIHVFDKEKVTDGVKGIKTYTTLEELFKSVMTEVISGG